MRIVIVGVGFAGLNAARELSGSGHDVLLVDRHNYHLFQPLLYQVATAGLEPEAIAYPIRALTRRWKGVRSLLADATGIDLERHSVITSAGPVVYDRLILAAGSSTSFFGLESVERRAFDLKELNDAVRLRNQILLAFEAAERETDAARRKAHLTFVIVGAGPTGVEFAGALSELMEHVLARDHPDISREDVRIVLVESEEAPLMAFPPGLRRWTRATLERKGIEVRTRTTVSAAEEGRVLLKDGTEITASTLFWAAGVRASPIADALPAEKAKAGRIRVMPDLSLRDHPEVLVAGDLAWYEQDGAALPMMAPVAMQMGRHAARVILARESGRKIRPFRYRDRGSMAVIGRQAAVAHIMGISFHGFPAWIVWLFLHLLYLVGFRNRLVTLLDWAWDYLFFERQVRLITGPGSAGIAGRGPPDSVSP